MGDIPADIYLRAKDELEQFYDGPIPNRAGAIRARALQLMRPEHARWRSLAMESRRRYMRLLDQPRAAHAQMEELDWLRQCIRRYVATKPRASLAQAAE